MVVQLRESRTRVSELEAELDYSKQNTQIQKRKSSMRSQFDYSDNEKETHFNPIPNGKGFQQNPDNMQFSQPINNNIIEMATPKRTALVDNIQFGNSFIDKDDMDFTGYNRAQLERMLKEFSSQKSEAERKYALAPKIGVSKSHAMQEKEELSDLIDELERKISKIKRQLK